MTRTKERIQLARCPDGGIDQKGYYGHEHDSEDMRLCADDQIRCNSHANEFDHSEGRGNG